MARIEGIGGNAELLHQLLEKTRQGGAAAELPPASGFHGRAARVLTNGEGQSLYEARESIMESMRAALRSGEEPKVATGQGGGNTPEAAGLPGPAVLRDAMTQALRANGFDPDEVRENMDPVPTSSGLFGGGAPGLPDVGALQGKGGLASSDVFIQQLLAQLPPGSTVDREA